MIEELSQGLTVGKTALDVVRGFRDFLKAHRNEIPQEVQDELRSKVDELYDAVISSREHVFEVDRRYAEARDKVQSLESQLRLARDAAAERKRYQLAEMPSGILVYRLRQEHVANGEPAHSLCPNCLDGDGRKSILQPRGARHVNCPKCGWVAEATSDQPRWEKPNIVQF